MSSQPISARPRRMPASSSTRLRSNMPRVATSSAIPPSGAWSVEVVRRNQQLGRGRLHRAIGPDRVLPAGDQDLLALAEDAVRADPFVARLLDPEQPHACLA